MRKSQLVKIIKEEIARVLLEQSSIDGLNHGDPDHIDFVAEILHSRGITFGGKYNSKESLVKAQFPAGRGYGGPLRPWFKLVKIMAKTGKSAQEILLTPDLRAVSPGLNVEPEGAPIVFGLGGFGFQPSEKALRQNISLIDNIATEILNKIRSGDSRIGGTAVSRGLKRRRGT